MFIPKIFLSIISTYAMNLAFLNFYIQKLSSNPKFLTRFFSNMLSTRKAGAEYWVIVKSVIACELSH